MPGTSDSMRRRKIRYLTMMGICLALFVGAWAIVRFYSVTAAVIMSAVAMIIPPFAAIVGNARDTDDPGDTGDTWESPEDR